MKKLVLLFLLVHLIGVSVLAQNYRNRKRAPQKPHVRVSFIVKSAQNISPDNIYITGNLPGFGPWNPGLIQLFRNPDGSWIGTYKMPLGMHVNLQYTRGNWDQTEVDVNGESIVHGFFIRRDTLIRHRIEAWSDGGRGTPSRVSPSQTPVVQPSAPPKPPPFQFVRYHKDLAASGVDPRNVTVYLPPAYETDASRSFPVLYVLDGQQRFHSSESIGGHPWQVGEVAKQMIRQNELREIIVVVVHNQNDYRLKSFSTREYRDFQNFMTKKLKPFIDEKYRTQSKAQETAIMGANVGGLVAFLTAWDNSVQFGKAICLSPIFDSPQLYFTYTKRVRDSYGFPNIRLYFDNGSSNAEKRLLAGIERMVKALEAQGNYPYFSEDYRKNVTGRSVQERIEKGLREMFGY